MNGVIGMAKGIRKPQESHERHLSLMLRDLVWQGVAVRARDTDTVRCGIYRNHPDFAGAEASAMQSLTEWGEYDRVLPFGCHPLRIRTGWLFMTAYRTVLFMARRTVCGHR